MPAAAGPVERSAAADGRYCTCPICFTTKDLDPVNLIAGAALQGTVPLSQWVGDEAATTLSY